MTATLAIGASDPVRELYERHLRAEGFEPTFAVTGREGLVAAERGSFGLIMLDLLLPDVTGAEVLRHLKQRPRTRDIPLMVVSALDAEVDRIVAFELGAVDYVVEPFSMRELVLRMRVALSGKSTRSESRSRTHHGLLVVDFESRRALVRDQEVALSPREFDLLCALQTRVGAVCSREELRDAVWGDAEVSTRTVDASVKRLRRKLGAARHSVETVRGVGYRFRQLEERVASRVA